MGLCPQWEAWPSALCLTALLKKYMRAKMGKKDSRNTPRLSNGGDIWLLKLSATRVGA